MPTASRPKIATVPGEPRLPRAIAALRSKPLTTEERADAKRRALAALERMTEEEDNEVTRAALSDPDTPLWDEVAGNNERRRAGRPPLPRTKRSVHLRIDQEVVDFFVKDGAGWQTRMNAALRKAAGLK
jgi:uncharacterized protein (DUF4415 family)